jgi:hypothetical protein
MQGLHVQVESILQRLKSLLIIFANFLPEALLPFKPCADAADCFAKLSHLVSASWSYSSSQ